MDYSIEVAGVNSLLLRFSEKVDKPLIIAIGQCCELIKQCLGDSLIDLIPSYSTILITYDLLKNDDENVREVLSTVLYQLQSQRESTSGVNRQHKQVILPVCYDAELAPDLALLSETLALDCHDIIRLHCERPYQVYAIGFSPGFGYLGELNSALRIPRLFTPRTSVPAGSVAIAELNTAVYPQATPGGWWLIGRCPVPMFDKNRTEPCLFSVGDEVIFEPISATKFRQLQAS
jgi:KipI family sensor histidine kinase inhibitor